jgi:hypothetical protein
VRGLLKLDLGGMRRSLSFCLHSMDGGIGILIWRFYLVNEGWLKDG